jgi:hypothetical protein
MCVLGERWLPSYIFFNYSPIHALTTIQYFHMLQFQLAPAFCGHVPRTDLRFVSLVRFPRLCNVHTDHRSQCVQYLQQAGTGQVRVAKIRHARWSKHS